MYARECLFCLSIFRLQEILNISPQYTSVLNIFATSDKKQIEKVSCLPSVNRVGESINKHVKKQI